MTAKTTTPKPRIERHRYCGSCRQHRPQKPEWGLGSTTDSGGLATGLITEVCGNCRFPEPPDPRRVNPRFIADLGLSDPERFALAAELDTLPARARAAAASLETQAALAGLAAAVRAGGVVDVDATALTQERRQTVAKLLRDAAERGSYTLAAGLRKLRESWQSWTDETEELESRWVEVPRIADPEPGTGLPSSLFRDVEVAG